MSLWRLALRSLLHYRRTQLGVLLGVVCASAVLVGAILVGASVRQTLAEQALLRVGRVDVALTGGDRFFGADLAGRLMEREEGLSAAAILQASGVVATSGDADARTGIVDVFGVDDRFFALSSAGTEISIEPGKALVNRRLAAQLGVAVDDELLVRVQKPSVLPAESVMATVDEGSFGLRVRVAGVVTEEEFGRFGLRASQIPPFNLFVDRSWMAEQLEVPGRANTILAAAGDGAAPSVVAERASAAMAGLWTLEDAELELRTRDDGTAELATRRIFLDEAVVDLVAREVPGAVGVLSYFVNTIRGSGGTAPYSVVTAVGPLGSGSAPSTASLAQVTAGLADGGVAVNQWLADRLGLTPGDAISVTYFAVGERLELLEREATFEVGRIVPLSGAAYDRGLMPEFPGLSETTHCRDWDPGIPVELDRLGPEDEQYWTDHQGTPKVFTTLAKGQELWANRYGTLTAVRLPAAEAARLPEVLKRNLDPAAIGFFFHDIRTPAITAGSPATDFGGLFLGLSMFLIGAALLLAAMLFSFGVEQRTEQIGLLLGLGYRPVVVRRLLLIEGFGVAVLGSLLGAGLGVLYTQLVLDSLATVWRGAVGDAAIAFHAPASAIATGVLSAVVVAVLSMAVTLRRRIRRPAVELLRSAVGVDLPVARPSRWPLYTLVGSLCGAVALAIAAAGTQDAAAAAGSFFGVGALCLIAGVMGARLTLSRAGGRDGVEGSLRLRDLAWRNAGRRRGRSLATVVLLASGTFLVVAVQANQLAPPGDPGVRSAGTGGFRLFARSTLPVLRDLQSLEGQDSYGLDPDELAGSAIVPLRVRDGDDASCLNLSTPQQPRLIGVDPAALTGRFTFAATAEEVDDGWELLTPREEGVVPAIGDAASVTWTLHKGIGDDIPFVDEDGREFVVRIVGTVSDSILQGNLVVADSALRARFPSSVGHRMFLIDVAADRAGGVTSELSDALQDYGFEVTPTAQRLAAFQQVQNTYLVIFQALGGLGLLLGSVGLGIVVLRNTLERRSELALLSAVGYSAGAVRRLLWSEHLWLLVLGLGVGSVAALVAVVPTGRSSGLPSSGLWGLGILASGAVWTLLATRIATSVSSRGQLVSALRGE